MEWFRVSKGVQLLHNLHILTPCGTLNMDILTPTSMPSGPPPEHYLGTCGPEGYYIPHVGYQDQYQGVCMYVCILCRRGCVLGVISAT